MRHVSFNFFLLADFFCKKVIRIKKKEIIFELVWTIFLGLKKKRLPDPIENIYKK